MAKYATEWKNDIGQNTPFEPEKCIQKSVLSTCLVCLSFSLYLAYFSAHEKLKLTQLELISASLNK